ncbi:MAG: ATP-binding protein [Thermoplasmata archaeon]|nr:ATP-binding protein [Thermoplasmata archaeon]
MDEDLVERELYSETIVPLMGNGNVNVIQGIRRCGKSSQMRALSHRLKGYNVVLVDMELASNYELRDWKKLLRHIEDSMKPDMPNAVLIDEVQDVPQWELAVRDIVARNLCMLFVTGSNANLLSSEYTTYLGGRMNRFFMLPLTYRECLKFREKYGGEGDVLQRLMRVGGFPIIWSFPVPNASAMHAVKDILDVAISNDIQRRFPDSDTDTLDRILRTVMSTVGKYASANNIYNTLKSDGTKISSATVYSILSRLEAANIVIKAHAYDIEGRRNLTTRYKYYAADVGLIHAVVGYKQGRIPAYMENLVYVDLRSRGYDVYVGDEKGLEVDFVAMKDDRMLYVQICMGFTSEDVMERELRSLESIDDNFPKYVVLLEAGVFAGPTDKGIEIIGLREFLSSDI